MKVTRKQLRQIIKEEIGRVHVQTRLRGQNDREAFASGILENEIEVHSAPSDLDMMSSEEAYGVGYQKGKDMQCDHPDWSPACARNDQGPDDPDLDDDGFLSIAELIAMTHAIVDDVKIQH